MVVVLFITISYIVQINLDFFKNTIGNSPSGMLVYILVVIIGIVIAPISSLPLLPIAVGLWGLAVAVILSIIGWFIGAGIAYELSRLFGKELIKKIIKIETIEKYSTKIPERYSFAGLLLLRLSVPVDILSYSLGLFTSVGRKLYYSSTLIGIIPFAFMWAYLGTFNYWYQIITFLLAGIIIYLGFKMRV